MHMRSSSLVFLCGGGRLGSAISVSVEPAAQSNTQHTIQKALSECIMVK